MQVVLLRRLLRERFPSVECEAHIPHARAFAAKGPQPFAFVFIDPTGWTVAHSAITKGYHKEAMFVGYMRREGRLAGDFIPAGRGQPVSRSLPGRGRPVESARSPALLPRLTAQ